jgi:hypothetical protein
MHAGVEMVDRELCRCLNSLRPSRGGGDRLSRPAQLLLATAWIYLYYILPCGQVTHIHSVVATTNRAEADQG